MSHISPAIRAQFESMPTDLKNAILEMDVNLNSMGDLMACLERIISSGEAQG
jgi:hypothetical protein